MEDLTGTLAKTLSELTMNGVGASPQLLRLNGEKIEDVEYKFWKHRILFSIIESIVTSETQLPGLPAQALKYLENILRDVRLRKLGGDDVKVLNTKADLNGNPITDSSDGDHTQGLTPAIKSLLSKYISMELKTLAQSVVKVYLDKLKSENASDEDRNKLSQLTQSQNPLELIVQFAIQREEDENVKKAQIEELKEQRDKELIQYKLKLAELKDAISRFVKPDGLLQQCPIVDADYAEYLKIEGDNLLVKTQMTKMTRLIDENPPELISELDETLKEMNEIIEELEKEISDTNELESRFNSLSPEFQEVLRERERVEEDIRSKEWALKSLENYDCDSSFNESFSESGK